MIEEKHICSSDDLRNWNAKYIKICVKGILLWYTFAYVHNGQLSRIIWLRSLFVEKWCIFAWTLTHISPENKWKFFVKHFHGVLLFKLSLVPTVNSLNRRFSFLTNSGCQFVFSWQLLQPEIWISMQPFLPCCFGFGTHLVFHGL